MVVTVLAVVMMMTDDSEANNHDIGNNLQAGLTNDDIDIDGVSDS